MNVLWIRAELGHLIMLRVGVRKHSHLKMREAALHLMKMIVDIMIVIVTDLNALMANLTARGMKIRDVERIRAERGKIISERIKGPSHLLLLLLLFLLPLLSLNQMMRHQGCVVG